MLDAPRLLLLPLALVSLAVAGCTPSPTRTAPVPRPNEWTVTDWHGSTHAPTATANFRQHIWLYITRASLKLDTTKDSVAHVTFRLAVQCDRCEFYFKTSEAVDDQGVQWNLTDITPNTRRDRGGFGWVVGLGSRQLYLVYSSAMAGRGQLPSTLTLTIREPGFNAPLRFHPVALSLPSGSPAAAPSKDPASG